MKQPRLSKAETRILEQYWKLGTASVREILESLPEDEGLFTAAANGIAAHPNSAPRRQYSRSNPTGSS